MKKIFIVSFITLLLISMLFFTNVNISAVEIIDLIETSSPARGNVHGIARNNGYLFCAGDQTFDEPYTYTVTKYDEETLEEVSTTSTNLGCIISDVEEDGTYVYACTTASQKIFKYWQSNLTKVDESLVYGGNCLTLLLSNEYIYVGGDTINKIYQYDIDTLTKTGESSSYGGKITDIVCDDTYIYACGETTNKIYQYWKTNLTKKAESESYGGICEAISEDTNYVYLGGETTDKVYKYLKTDLSFVDMTESIGETIFYISADKDDTFFWFTANDGLIYQCYKSNMTIYAQTNVYASDGFFCLSIDDTNKYIYAGGEKIYKFNYTSVETLEEEEPCEDAIYQSNTLSGYSQLPIGFGYGKYLEDKFTALSGSGITGNITDVRLSISQDQKNSVSTLASYTCVVNGNQLGEADGMYGVGSDWWVYWFCDIPITENEPIFSFGQNTFINYGASGMYWHGVGTSVNIPFLYNSKYHNSSVYHNNSFYDGTSQSFDIIYKFTVECVEEETPSNDTSETNATAKDIYIKFYDKSNGDLLRFKGLDVAESLMFSYDFIDALLYSTYTTNGLRSSYQTNDYLTVNINFTEGTFITFKVMDFDFKNYRGREDGSYKMFKAMEYTIQAYEGQTYTFYLEPVGFIDGVIYNNSGNDKTSGSVECAINKRYYDFGETIRLRYKLPSEQWLVENGYVRSSYYRLKIYNKDDYLFGYVRRNAFWEASRVYEYAGLIFDNTYHTLDIPIISYNAYGFDDYYNDYEIVIENWDRDFLKKDTLLDSLYFWVTGDEYIPNGTIYDIEPNPAYFGQSVTISWFSNGQGRIEINYPSGDTYFSVPYLYSDGLHTIEKTMTGIGTFSVELYTYSILENTSYPVDTDTLVVNPLGGNGTYGSYGFGLPYLYIPNYRVIAGYDTVQIYYRTYKNNSILKVLSPRGETTYFSTTVSNQSDNVLNIPIPNYMQIGEWNVTFLCGDINGTSTTLYSSFNVVNEENNWIEFTKHVYNTDEVFEVFIKHSYRVALTLYKDDVAQGETIIFNLGEYANAKYLIPLSVITPSIGNWRVEMWRINDRNIVYELAEDECIVKQGTNKNKIDIGFGIVIPPLIKIILGILIVVVMTILPMLISFALSRGGTSINIPALVYVAFFFFGLVISVILDFISIIVPFIILFGLVIAFAVMWLRGQSTGE